MTIEELKERLSERLENIDCKKEDIDYQRGLIEDRAADIRDQVSELDDIATDISYYISDLDDEIKDARSDLEEEIEAEIVSRDTEIEELRAVNQALQAKLNSIYLIISDLKAESDKGIEEYMTKKEVTL